MDDKEKALNAEETLQTQREIRDSLKKSVIVPIPELPEVITAKIDSVVKTRLLEAVDLSELTLTQITNGFSESLETVTKSIAQEIAKSLPQPEKEIIVKNLGELKQDDIKVKNLDEISKSLNSHIDVLVQKIIDNPPIVNVEKQTLEWPMVASKPLAVRLSDGKNFYNAMFAAASGNKSTVITDASGNAVTVTNNKLDVNATVNASIDTTGLATDTNQTSGSQKTQIVDAGGEVATVTGGKLDVNATASLAGDAIPASGATTAVTTQIVDGSGNQITSFGGGTQYTEGDTDASITGTAIMFESNTGTNAVSTVNSTTPLPVTVANTGANSTAIKVDGSATTQPISGTVTASNVSGDVASGSADSGNPVKVGGRYNATKPTLTDGQRGDLQTGTRGSLNVTLFGENGTTGAVMTANGADATSNTGLNGLNVHNYNKVYNGTTWDRMPGDTTGVKIQDGGNSITVDNGGTFAVQGDITKLGGNNINTGSGTVGTGTLRVAHANDVTVKVDGSGVTQPVSFSATTAEQGSLSAGSLNADLVASTDVTNYKWFSVQIAGTWSGTITFQASNDNSNFVSLGVQNTANNATASASTTVSNGVYYGAISFKYLRIRMTSYLSGTATGTLELYDRAAAFNTMAVAAGQNGTWTVQPGNTANTTAWKVDGSAVTQPISDGGGSITVDGTVATTSAAPSTLIAFRTDIPTAGSRVQLGSNACSGVVIQAPSTNTGLVYVGGSSVSSTVCGAELQPGQSTGLAIDNTNKIYVDCSVSGDDVMVLGS